MVKVKDKSEFPNAHNIQAGDILVAPDVDVYAALASQLKAA